jgi:hypothetical protein
LSKTFDVYANVLSGANVGSFQASVSASSQGSVTGTLTTASTVSLQAISVTTSGSLSATTGAADAVSAIVMAGSSNVSAGQYSFSASNSAYTIQTLDVAVTGTGSSHDVADVTISYKDATGAIKTATTILDASYVAHFSGLTLYVPSDDQADLSVSVSIPTIASGSVSGTVFSTSMAATNFRAVDASGRSLTSFGSSVASNGQFTVRKSVPTFAMQSAEAYPSTGTPLYSFKVTADNGGTISLSSLTFNIATSSAVVNDVKLIDYATGLEVGSTVASSSSAVVTIPSLQVASGSSKNLYLTGTVLGFTTGSSITIRLSDALWSDRSASGDIGVALLKNFTNNTSSYSK